MNKKKSLLKNFALALDYLIIFGRLAFIIFIVIQIKNTGGV